MGYSYSYFTRRQADIIYAAWKQGRVNLDRSRIRDIYGIVGKRELSHEESRLEVQAENAVRWLIEDEDEYAQACLDGFYVIEQYRPVTRIATEEDFFYEIGEEYEEDEFCGYEIVSPEEYHKRRYGEGD